MKKLATKILKQQKPSAKNLVVAQKRDYARQNKATFVKSANVATENPHTTYPVAAVFGSTGFIGKAVVHELSQAGYQVITPYRGDDFRPMNLKVMGDVGQIVPMRWDPKREDTVLDICSRANIVVNCVGRDYPTYIMDDSWEFSNVTTASIVSKACKDTYVERMIHLSCLGADIEHPSKLMRLKAMSELKVKEHYPEATIVRPAQAYGPTDRWLNFIGRSLHPTKAMGVPTVLQAQQKVQPVFVGNIADAIVAILSYVGTKGLVYELGGPKVYKLSEIIKFVADHINQRYTVTSLPVPLAKIVAIYNEMRRLTPTFTMDYVDRLQYDSVVSENALTFKDLRIDPIPFEEGSTDTLRKFWRPPLYLIKNAYD